MIQACVTSKLYFHQLQSSVDPDCSVGEALNNIRAFYERVQIKSVATYTAPSGGQESGGYHQRGLVLDWHQRSNQL